MRLSSPDPNTKCGMGAEVLPSLDVCVVCVWGVGGDLSVLPFQSSGKYEDGRAGHGARATISQECPILNVPEKPGAPTAQGPTGSEQLCLH